MCGGRGQPLQGVGEGDEGVGGVERHGQDGVTVVVPVNNQPGPLQPAVESQGGEGGHTWRGDISRTLIGGAPTLLPSHWSLRQLSYAIKNQLVASKAPY